MKSASVIVVTILSIFIMSSVYSTTYYVNGTTGNDLWDGLAAVWDGTHGPKKTIQAGINASADNDIVSVSDGTYAGAGNKDLDFGGRAITVESQNGAETCIIDCEGAGRGFYFHSGETVNSVVRGFTIKNGSMTNGGGIYCVSSAPKITHCVLTNNTATQYGGGIYAGNATVTYCTVKGNSAGQDGGGVYSGGSTIITNCTISDNFASSVGGGMCFLGGSTASVSDCTISGNICNIFGGGLYWYDSSPTINNCDIIDNIADGGGGIFSYNSNAVISNCRVLRNNGGGIELFHDDASITNCVISENNGSDGAGIQCGDSNSVITNCTITGNTTSGDGAGIYVNSTSSPTIINCIIWANEGEEIYVYTGGNPLVAYSDVQGGWFGIGNINKDPMLLPSAGGRIRLKHGSPCIDAGTSAAPAPPADMDGRSRWDDPNTPNTGGGATAYYDMGAYEFKGWYVNGNPAIGNDAYNGAYPTWIGGVNGPERTIQAGINDAADGDVVTVAPWTYDGPGNVELNFANGLPGGETRLITLTASAGADTTFIDCKNTNRGFNFITYEDTTAMVHGFTIRNGYSSSYGGGIRCEDSSPTISGCVLFHNYATTDGGGIDCWNASPVISNCTIAENTANAGYGGGINCWFPESNPTIMNCRITNNLAALSHGGGISCYRSSPTIFNNLITSNRSKLNGGGIWCYQSNVKISNCTFSLNEAQDCGSGIACDASSPTITDCILWDDVSDEICVVSGSPMATYSDIEGGTGQPWFGTGCIDKDPLFVSGPLHDFYLSQIAAGQAFDSKCVDRGSALASVLGMHKFSTRTDRGKDIDTVDMGYHVLHVLYIYNITRNGNDITIYWKNSPGASYTVQYSKDMINWNNVTVGNTDNWTDIGGASSLEVYYRVREE